MKDSTKKFLYNKIIIIFILILIIISILILSLRKTHFNNSTTINKKLSENEEEFFSYLIYDNQDEDAIKTLVTIISDTGIDYIEKPDGGYIYANGKNKVSLDYVVKKDEKTTFKIKEINKEIVEKYINITDEKIYNEGIGLDIIYDLDGYEIMQVNNKINNYINSTYKISYKIGNNGKWVNANSGTKFSLVDYDLNRQQLLNSDGTVTVTAKAVNTSTSNTIIYSKNVDMYTDMSYNELNNQESLLAAIGNNELKTGHYDVTISNELYGLSLYNYKGNIDIQVNTVFGMATDVATSNTYAQNMIVLKVEGNLTINSGVTLTSYASEGGYGGPKGMIIYCTGTLTNNGTIDMTARGAKAVGQNVYLWKNEDDSYEYVPAIGASGGTASTSYGKYSTYASGNNGANGTNRGTGGGGSGSVYGWYQTVGGAGAKGTSYSGRYRWWSN